MDGSFSIDLVPADYVIGMNGCKYASCEVFPLRQTIVAGETVTFNRDFDTGIRSLFNDAGVGRLTADITNQGVAVGMGAVLTQPFFEPQGRTLIVNDESIHIFPFAAPEETQAAAVRVAPDGGSVGTIMVIRVEPPHFYQYDAAAPESLIVIYAGSDPAVLSLLQAVVGAQFAGADPGVIDTFVAPDVDDPQAQVEAYVALMLDLRGALAQVGNPDSHIDAEAEAIAIGAEIATYTPFFQGLSDRIIVSLFQFCGERMQAVNAEVAEHIARIVSTMTGVEELIAVLQLGPAFALESTSDAPDREVVEVEVMEEAMVTE